MKHYEVAAAVIRRKNMLLLADRPLSKPPQGWEFPGGKVEKGETLGAALERELREELGVDSTVLDPLFEVTTANLERSIHITFLRTLVAPDAVFTGCEGQHFGWFDLQGPPPPELLAPDGPVWEFLAEGCRSRQ